MTNKLMSILDLMKEKKEKVTVPTKYPGITVSNRFAKLAERPSTDGKSVREAKRSRIESETEDECEEIGEDSVFTSMEKIETEVKEAKELIEQVKKEVGEGAEGSPLSRGLGMIIAWMEKTTAIQVGLASVMVDGFNRADKKVSAAAKEAVGEAKAVVGELVGEAAKGGNPADKGKKGMDSSDEARKKKFVQAVNPLRHGI